MEQRDCLLIDDYDRTDTMGYSFLYLILGLVFGL